LITILVAFSIARRLWSIGHFELWLFF